RRIGLADDVVGGIEARDVSTYRESKRSGRFRAKVGIRDEGGFVFLVEDAERRKDFACRQVENRTADGRLGDRLLDLGRVQRVDADVVGAFLRDGTDAERIQTAANRCAA